MESGAAGTASSQFEVSCGYSRESNMLSILITIIAVALSNASDANGGNGVPVAIGGNETGVLHVAQRDEDGNRLTLDL